MSFVTECAVLGSPMYVICTPEYGSGTFRNGRASPWDRLRLQFEASFRFDPEENRIIGSSLLLDCYLSITSQIGLW
jgi:hypothetical protein